MRGLVLLLLVGCGSKKEVGGARADAPAASGDALTWLSRSPTSTFWETTDVAAKGDVVYTCTGVASLTVHDASRPEELKVLEEVRFSESGFSFPRCSHVDVLKDRVLVGARSDEVQPEAWIALMDASKPRQLVELDSRGFGDQLVEEPVLTEKTAWVAATDAGVIAFDITADTLIERGRVPIDGSANRIGRAPGGGVAVGTLEGGVYLVDEDLEVTASFELGAIVNALEPVGDRLAVALGSAGIAIVDPTTGEVAVVDTNGVAVRLWAIDDHTLAVANWSDLRVYDLSGTEPVLRAVDAVLQAEEDQPRTFGVAASGDRVYAGMWTGLHALRWDREVIGPELSLSSRQEGVPADGEAHDVPVRVLNEGQENLIVDDIKAPGGWSVSPRELVLAPGDEQEVVFHTGGSTGVSLGDARFLSNDPDEKRARLPLRIGSNRVFEGDPAVDFTYTALNLGTTHTLSEQRGKVVLLAYWATF